jgi:hypothetical protein
MSPQQNNATSSIKRFLLVVIFGAASIFLIKGIYALGSAQSQGSSARRINGKPLADKESAAERISFNENGPQGRWSASVLPDLSRTEFTSPILVVGTSTLMGNAQWRNLQLTHITLKSFSSKTSLGVQLKWFITTRAEPTKILPPPGYTGLFEAYLRPGESQKVECPLIKFSQAVRYLIKDGNLDGDFLLHVRVFQVEFEDGSSWNDDWNGPKPGEKGESWRGPEESQQNHSSFLLQTPCAHTLCSYSSPDSHSFCEPHADFQLTCNLGPPCSVDGVFCTCDHTLIIHQPHLRANLRFSVFI